MRKYEIVGGRVKALRDFSDVLKGGVGGYVEGEHNLSHEGDCWIYGNAEVLVEAMKEDNQIIEIAVSDELRLKLIKSWLNNSLTPESASVYESTGDMEQAVFNEAVIDILKEQIKINKWEP